jgi:hypothetical protein
MAKDGIEQSWLRGKGSSSGLSQSVHHCNQQELKREWNMRRKEGVVVCFFQSTHHGKIWSIERKRHTKIHEHPSPLIGYLEHKEPKEGNTDSPSFDMLAIAIDENQRNGIKNTRKEH